MTNPYATPNSRPGEHREVTHYRVLSLALCLFGTFLTLPELWSNALRPFDNPIGNAMGVAIIVATGIAACAEWFPGQRIARLAVVALWVLAVVASVVIVRFVTSFVPILTKSWVVQNPGVIMGFVFSLCALLYIGIVCLRRVMSRVASRAG